jgi:hypothetical protein
LCRLSSNKRYGPKAEKPKKVGYYLVNPLKSINLAETKNAGISGKAPAF